MEIKVEFSGIDELNDFFDNTVKKMKSKIHLLNKERATKFRKDTIADMITGRLGLKSIYKETALARQENKGGPLYDTGELAHAQKIKKGKDGSYEDGYWLNDSEKHSNTDMTNAELASLHTTGARFKKKKGRIPSRPFMSRSADKYEKSDNDQIIAKRWMSKHVF